MKAVPENLIRQRAYAIWEQSGRPQGRDTEHWLQAELELLDAAPEIKAADSIIAAIEKSLGQAPASEKIPTAKLGRSKARGEPARVR